MHKIIDIQDLDIGYNHEVLLKNLRFSVSVGEILVILGANGVGKSTLIKTLLGLMNPLKGRVLMAEGVRIGFMPQMRPEKQYLPMTVRDFLDLFTWAPSWRDQVIKAMEIDKFLEKDLHEISYGMWQRVNFAQAISAKANLLFLDEPSQGMDIHWQSRCYEFLSYYAHTYQAAVCCVSHDTIAVSKYAHKILCLDHQPAHQVSLMERATKGEEFIIYQHHHH